MNISVRTMSHKISHLPGNVKIFFLWLALYIYKTKMKSRIYKQVARMLKVNRNTEWIIINYNPISYISIYKYNK